MNKRISPLALSTAIFLVISTGGKDVLAQTVVGATTNAEIAYQIPSGELSMALVQFSLQSGLQLIAPSKLTEGHTSPGLSGHYTVSAALSHLLSGSGLNYRLDNEFGTITLYQESQTTSGNQLGTVKVEGAQQAVNFGGANGSTDVTATEGTHSYSTTAISIGSKTPQSLKDTPQTVSVTTAQQIKDQNISSLDELMAKVPGVITQANGSSQAYYSRGWQVKNIQIDGGTPFRVDDTLLGQEASGFSAIDMSMYDHAEVLRGGDSLNSVGNSSPGGSINLTRKRPLDHSQTLLTGQAGSWNNYRTSLDLTGPLAFDGRVRGRVVTTWQDKNYFYHPADENTRLLYGILEADVTPDTLFTVGGSHTEKNGLPWDGGLPRYQSGRDPRLPRDTSLALPWSHKSLETNELFTQIKQNFNDNWSLASQLTYLKQIYGVRQGSLNGALSDLTADSRYSDMSAENVNGEQYLADINLNGKFDVFQLPQKVSLSASHQYNRFRSHQDIKVSGKPTLQEPEPDWQTDYTTHSRYITSNLVGKLDTVFLPFLPDLHFQTAGRWDQYHAHYKVNPVSGTSTVTDGREERVSVPYYTLRYDITPYWSVYGSYTELYEYQAYLRAANNTTLPPMKGNTKEVGVKYNKGSLNASLAAYRSERTNQATFDNNHFGCSIEGCYRISSSEEISEGADFEVSGEPTPWWSVTLGYSYNNNKKTLDPDDTDTDRVLSSFTPKHQFKLWNDFRLWGNHYLNNTRVGFGVISQTKSYTAGQICAKLNEYNNCDGQYVPYNFDQGFYSIFSARAAYQINNNWSVAMNINNLFDRRYYSTTAGADNGNWYGEPRNFMVTVNGAF